MEGLNPEKLPEGVLAHVFSFLHAKDVVSCMQCSKTFHKAAMSGTPVWKSLCERLALDSLEEISVRAMELGVNENEDGPEYWRRAFIVLQRNPLLRYRFLRTIPTLGLNVQTHERNENPRVFGGFSFGVASTSEREEREQADERRGRSKKRRTSKGKGQNQDSILLPKKHEVEGKYFSLKRKNKLVSDYECFKVRESVEVRGNHRQRMYECLDACTGRVKAVKLVGFGERPEEGLKSRKLREAANLKVLSTQSPQFDDLGSKSIAKLERVVTVDEDMPFFR